MHLRLNFDACPMHSPFGFVHLTHQNLSARALFCLNSLAKVNTQLLIYNYKQQYKCQQYRYNEMYVTHICDPSHQNRPVVGRMHFKILLHLYGKKQRK